MHDHAWDALWSFHEFFCCPKSIWRSSDFSVERAIYRAHTSLKRLLAGEEEAHLHYGGCLLKAAR